MPKQVNEWDVDEVAIWLNCIGLSDKVTPFRENTVDGETLIDLSVDDLVKELGLTSLQAKKVLRLLRSAEGGGDGDSEQSKELEAEVASLKQQLGEKDRKIQELQDQLIEMQKAAAPKQAPPAPPPPKQQQPIVLGRPRVVRRVVRRL